MEQEKEETKQFGYNTGMLCPICKSSRSRVFDKRNNAAYIIRRRECDNKHRFTTKELVGQSPLGPISHEGFIDTKHPHFPERLKKALVQSVDYYQLAKSLHDI